MCMIPSDNNPAMGLAVHNRSDVSIGTQPEEETMQGDKVIETTG